MLQNIIFVLSFPLALLIYNSIILANQEKKSKLTYLKSYTVYVLAFLPILLIPNSTRILYAFISSIVLFLTLNKVNIYQSFWLTTFFIFAVSIIEIIITMLLFKPIVLIFNPQLQEHLTIINNTLMLTSIIITSVLLKRKINKFITDSHIIKNYQITYPLFVLSIMILWTLFVTLITNEVFAYRTNIYISAAFLLSTLALSVVIVLGIDKYLKNKNELLKLNARFYSFTGSENAKSKGVVFEQSIEFDLMQSEFGSKIHESFKLESLLYKSPNSSIYLMKNTDESKFFTLKVIEKKDGLRYDFEGLKHITHPTIAPIVEIAEGENYHYIIKSFADGVDLNRYVLENGPIGEPLLTDLIKQLAFVLDDLHSGETPIVFRDLKPSNIIFNSEQGTIQLIDIESIRKFNSGKSSDTFIIGSRGYAPPEQYGFSQTLPQSDIYAFGATIYYLATGVEPDFVYISSKIHQTDLSETLKIIIKKCMSFNPEDRYSSINEVMDLIYNNAW